jgi:hypothetical protein
MATPSAPSSQPASTTTEEEDIEAFGQPSALKFENLGFVFEQDSFFFLTAVALCKIEALDGHSLGPFYSTCLHHH